MEDDKPTPPSHTMPPIQQENKQGQGSPHSPPTEPFQPKVPLEKW